MRFPGFDLLSNYFSKKMFWPVFYFKLQSRAGPSSLVRAQLGDDEREEESDDDDFPP